MSESSKAVSPRKTKTLAERDEENGPLRKANAAAERTISELRDEIASLNGGKSPLIDGLRNEMVAAERALRAAHDERAKLQRDINVIQQQAESSGAAEHMENALLRERINDIAAEVARLAMTIEGPDSPIKAILAADTARPKATKTVNGTASNGAPPLRRHAGRPHPRAAIPGFPQRALELFRP